MPIDDVTPISAMTTAWPTAGTLRFPERFLWGSATSSYQIEGAAELDGRSLSIWDVFCREEGRIKDGSSGAVACDHYHRYRDDVTLMAGLGLQAYRFSIAWPRVVPEGVGPVNQAGLDFYDRLVDALLEQGIRPMPTLYHWDLPHALEQRGGWVVRDTAEAFADYAAAVVDRLGDRIGTWTTLNEPFVSANHGYVTGEHAPGRTSMAEGMAASHHLLLAHGLAGERIRSLAPDARLAIVINFTDLIPATDDAEDRVATHHQDALENRWYTDPLAGYGYPADSAEHFDWDQGEVRDGDLALISQPIDLLGVNFYTRGRVARTGEAPTPTDLPRNTMGWEIHPPSLGRLLRWLRDRYDFPSYLITENGAPMPDIERVDGRIEDDDRLGYIRDHLAQVHGAIADGCPIEGYLVWSLFDNFEWAWGYGPRFGIVEVDFETLERTPKKSAEWFAAAAAANGFDFPGPIYPGDAG
ncbi:MAG: GH1 family beta-glucosidase [Actinomycetota bacterium]